MYSILYIPEAIFIKCRHIKIYEDGFLYETLIFSTHLMAFNIEEGAKFRRFVSHINAKNQERVLFDSLNIAKEFLDYAFPQDLHTHFDIIEEEYV